MKAYILGAIVGGVIGYITNWLAIKMLFRPYERKYFLGIKIPFTPGVIPKEKGRIAKSVGESIGTHLLNSETLVKALSNEDIKYKGKKLINAKINGFINKDYSLDLFFANLLKQDYIKLKKVSIEKINNKIIHTIKDESNIIDISQLISNILKEKLHEKPILLNKLIDEGHLRRCILNLVNKYKYNGNIDEFINKSISNELSRLVVEEKKIKDILPHQSMDFINELLIKERKNIVNEIKLVMKRESVSYSIKKAIGDNIPSIVSMFLSSDSIYEKVVNATNNYLDKDENQRLIASTIGCVIVNYNEKPIIEMLNNLSKENIDNLTKDITNTIINKTFNEETIDKIIDILEMNLRNYESYHHLLITIDSNYEENMEKILKSFLETSLYNEKFDKIIKKSVEKFIYQLLQTSTNDICYNKDQIMDKVDVFFEEQYENFIKNNASEVVNIIDIPKLVEEQINSFEVSYGEKIILDIANKELKAITWLGALLGAILGIISPLLATFYM